MSYNNYLDADAAWNCVSEFENPTCVVVKHTNPCGVASRQDVLEAYRLAVKGDPVSAFGGIVAFNTTIDEVSRRLCCHLLQLLTTFVLLAIAHSCMLIAKSSLS
jgi:AICAR transformylase/IMP cyclohydrolase PurH